MIKKKFRFGWSITLRYLLLLSKTNVIKSNFMTENPCITFHTIKTGKKDYMSIALELVFLPYKHCKTQLQCFILWLIRRNWFKKFLYAQTSQLTHYDLHLSLVSILFSVICLDCFFFWMYRKLPSNKCVLWQ